jgi:hypothetical protein
VGVAAAEESGESSPEGAGSGAAGVLAAGGVLAGSLAAGVLLLAAGVVLLSQAARDNVSARANARANSFFMGLPPNSVIHAQRAHIQFIIPQTKIIWTRLGFVWTHLGFCKKMNP